MYDLFLILGAGLFLVTMADALWTTLWADKGAGPLSSFVSHNVWKGGKVLAGGRQWAISLTGPLTLVTTVSFWLALFWASWTLIFSSDPTSIVSASKGVPAGVWDRIYYVGYTIFTMGNGDFKPVSALWQIATNIANISSLFLISMTATYVLSVISATVNRRSLASQILALGSTPKHFIESSWDGSSFKGLELTLSQMSSSLTTLTEQHLAYPVLHYYHSIKREKSIVLGVALLNDLVLTLRSGVAAEVRPSKSVLKSLDAAIDSYVETVGQVFSHPTKEGSPPPFDLKILEDQGIPKADQEDLSQAVLNQEERRRALHQLVQADGWAWFDVH